MEIALLEKTQRISVSASDAEVAPLDGPPAVLDALYGYWREKKGARLAPSRADILPEEIADILPFVVLIELVGLRLRYRLVGTEIDRVFGTGMTGRFLDETDFNGVRALVVADYMNVVTAAAPSWTHWRFLTGQGRLLEYERLALPLSANGRHVNMILAGIVGEGLPPPKRFSPRLRPVLRMSAMRR